MKLFFLFIGISLISTNIKASDEEKVRGVIIEYHHAIKDYDVSIITKLLHPDALSRFRQTLDNAFNGDSAEKARAEILLMFSLENMEDYKKVDSSELYKRLNKLIVRTQPELIDMLKTSTLEIISVTFKDEICYVTYTMKINVEGQEVNSDIVQKLKRHEDSWLLLLSPSGESAVANFRSRYP